MTQKIINFQQVNKVYGDTTVVKDLDLEINEGEFFVLVGTSGSGKTTTLKMINHLITPTSGKVIVSGQNLNQANIRHLRLNIGYVLQESALFPNLTVEQNIAVIPEMKKWSKSKIYERVRELLEDVDLNPDEYAQRYPSDLSGGEQQRIGILRAIAVNPPLVLMDEPFSALDPIVRTQLQDLVLQIHRATKTTIVFVTHDMNEALRLGERIAVMRDGAIQQVATPQEITTNPANNFVNSFFAGSDLQQNPLKWPFMRIPKRYFKEDLKSLVRISPFSSINEALPLFASNELIRVADEKVDLGYLTRSSLFKFLAQES
ncbi:ABC transporter ATP-binding protein [Xylocopilactobacillus apis]|uniref:ABC-type quaternary amine transporter n=1 Tax=Xylocopilactobacillus apis TaxID=2932183 RepID=A0AAU9DNZ0_9LACO|nr:ABC transporter ATP-binding protein [Xylocopilactobacillus apis]BDR56693.1 ABC transporter ATP-binding protein [Xylocopilactobacillus apis]